MLFSKSQSVNLIVYLSNNSSLHSHKSRVHKVQPLFISTIDKPGSPVGPLVVSDITEDRVRLSWQPPEDDGGSRLTSYFIEKSEARRPRWLRVARVTPEDLTVEVSDLIENTDYYFRVIAENKMGLSSPLETQKPVRPVSPYCELTGLN